MKRFEYKVVQDIHTTVEILNKYGLDGWEMVFMTGIEDCRDLAIFMRELPEETKDN